MTCSAWFSAVGLVLDMVGVLTLLKYGLPSEWEGESGRLLEGETPEVEKARLDRNARIERGSRWGVAILVVGFLCQLAGTIISGSK